MTIRKSMDISSCTLALLFISACGQTWVRNMKLTQEKNLPRPSRILVADFAVNEREVTGYHGIMRRQPNIKVPAEPASLAIFDRFGHLQASIRKGRRTNMKSRADLIWPEGCVCERAGVPIKLS
jgi:hypothetical protein